MFDLPNGPNLKIVIFHSLIYQRGTSIYHYLPFIHIMFSIFISHVFIYIYLTVYHVRNNNMYINVHINTYNHMYSMLFTSNVASILVFVPKNIYNYHGKSQSLSLVNQP